MSINKKRQKIAKISEMFMNHESKVSNCHLSNPEASPGQLVPGFPILKARVAEKRRFEDVV